MNINIIGGGLSGLVTAKVLEENGYKPTIIEATNRPGGRVKTDIVNGFQLDRGFQVLLSEYPAALKHLDYAKLDLQSFGSGAIVFNNGKQSLIGDPLRNLYLLFPTIFSGIGNLMDKFRILKLNYKLKSKKLYEIFETPEKTTLQYLQDFGFSNDIISKFFKPFFTGIFLETELATSSRMFEFVFKMFAEGKALLPKQGIEAIPKQIVSNLKSTTFKFNEKVKSITDNTITLEGGEAIESDYTILAGEIDVLINGEKPSFIEWKSCTTIYFTSFKKLYSKQLIGLIADQNSLINNIFYHTSLETGQKGNGELLSVTIVKPHKLSNDELIRVAQEELKRYCMITNLTFLKLYKIPKALPKMSDLSFTKKTSKIQLTESIFMAGDIHLNASLNAAMLSGEIAAKSVLEQINNR